MVKALLAEDGRELKTWKRPNKGPVQHGYKRELDVADKCNEDMTSRFRQLIGILCWVIELCRIDIQVEVIIMSQYQALPRKGHFEALYLIFHYLSKNPKKRLAMDPNEPPVDKCMFNIQVNLMDFYTNIVEEDPPGMPEPLGQDVLQSVFVDSDHAGNVVTRGSHSGIFIFPNNALIKS